MRGPCIQVALPPQPPSDGEGTRHDALGFYGRCCGCAWVLVFLCCLHAGRLARVQDHTRKSAGWKISASSHLQTLHMRAAYMRTCIRVCVADGGHALAKLIVKFSRLYTQ